MLKALTVDIKDKVKRENLQMIRYTDLKGDKKLLANSILPRIPDEVEKYY